MDKNESEQRNQNSGSMLNQKTNEDYNKQQPNPNTQGLKKGNLSSEGGNQKTQDQKIFRSAITETRSEKDTYTCPMHPEVKSDKPGKCPKCGMQLIKKK